MLQAFLYSELSSVSDPLAAEGVLAEVPIVKVLSVRLRTLPLASWMDLAIQVQIVQAGVQEAEEKPDQFQEPIQVIEEK
jgi:hypothetical protein